MPSVRFHDLGHTFATHALASAKTLSGILGHTQASFMLNTYTRITDKMRRKAALNMD